MITPTTDQIPLDVRERWLIHESPRLCWNCQQDRHGTLLSRPTDKRDDHFWVIHACASCGAEWDRHGPVFVLQKKPKEMSGIEFVKQDFLPVIGATMHTKVILSSQSAGWFAHLFLDYGERIIVRGAGRYPPRYSQNRRPGTGRRI